MSCRPGLCHELQGITLQEFTHGSLTPLRFDHTGPGSRSPKGLEGGKAPYDANARLSGAPLSVHLVHVDAGNTVAVDLVSCQHCEC